jgi:lathosterol oxidase
MGLLTAPLFVAEIQGYSQLYTNVGTRPQDWAYLVVSACLFMAFNDTLIYWIHRALHTKMLYKHLHKTHHKWLVPTPFASHAFHPIDGWLQSLPYHLFVFLVPFHKITYLTMFVLVNFWTISIHDGNFQVPMNLRWLINGAAHHTDHHMYYNYNHGQYFTLWDRIGGTFREPSPFKGNGPLDQLSRMKQQKTS